MAGPRVLLYPVIRVTASDQTRIKQDLDKLNVLLNFQHS